MFFKPFPLSLFHFFVFFQFLVDSLNLFSSCSGELFISVFLVSLSVNLFLFTKFSFFIPSYSYFMDIIVYLTEDHFRIVVF